MGGDVSQWRAHQTGPHLSACLAQLQGEIAKVNVGTPRATTKANKLIRECFRTRDLSTRINQLGFQDPSQVCLVAPSDTAPANRTGACYVMEIRHEKPAPLGQLKREHFLRLISASCLSGLLGHSCAVAH